MHSGHDCKDGSVKSNTSDLDNSENYSNGTRNLDEVTDPSLPKQRSLRHNMRSIKSGNGNGAGENSSNATTEDEDDDEDDTLTTSSDDNDMYSKNNKNNNGTNIKRGSQKRTTTMKSHTEIEHSSSKKTRRTSALSIDLNIGDSVADAH